MKTDTIAAITTGMSPSGISKIRISGENAFKLAEGIYRSSSGEIRSISQKSHTIHYGYIVDGEEIIDEVMVLVMKGPRSYTKEDIVEIDCHGGIAVTKKVLETVLKNGVRLAEPGEFTKRAFLNGRIDLSQAEAVMELIQAKNGMAVKNSMRQLKGNVSCKISEIRSSILHDTAYIEAALDDPEHISLDGFGEILKENTVNNMNKIEDLIENSENGRILKEGVKTVILGKPNVGKSSFLNALLGEERAIVTEIAGTTRDILEENMFLNGLSLNIIDTAGIRETTDLVEQMGVKKAKEQAETADLLIYIVDASIPIDENDRQIIETIKDKKAIILLNKTDLCTVIESKELEKQTGKKVISVSMIEKKGMQEVQQEITNLFFQGDLKWEEEIYITNIRQKNALSEALESLKQVLISINAQMPDDFFSIDLMSAYETLGSIIGESVDEDLIHTIFSEFCMGK